MKACVTYTILDSIEMDFDGTSKDFEKVVEEYAIDIANEIFSAVGLTPNDIEISVIEGDY